VKPVKARSAPRGKPAKLAQRKRKYRQLAVEQYMHREFRSIEQTIGFPWPLPFAHVFFW
jgi:hypothetical protein